MSRRYDIAVLGAGAWGTALAVVHAAMGRAVALSAHNPARAAAMRATRQNPRLPGIALPDTLTITDHVPDAGILLIAVPMQVLRPALLALPAGAAPLVLCCKGLESGTRLLPPELAAALHPGRPAAILTGPNFAHEIAQNLPAAAVLATPESSLRTALMAELGTPSLRLYGSADITGAALGGAAKNVIAIAAGAIFGAGLGENARAALITRGIAEIARLALACGGRAETISGLSGLGDLLLTCTGQTSRNYALGYALGRGDPLQTILQRDTAVTEGVATAPALLARAQDAGVDMPVTAAVAALLSGGAGIQDTVSVIMARALKEE